MTAYKVGDYVVHGCEVGQIVEIVDDFRGLGPCYRIRSLVDESLMVTTSVNNTNKLTRSVISRQAAENLVDSIADLELIEDEGFDVESAYDQLVKHGNFEDMLRLIHANHARCAEKLGKSAAQNVKDKTFLRLGEKLFYSEMSVALGKSYEDTKEYILDKMSALSLTGG